MDARLRETERHWKSGGDLDDKLRLYRERLRAGLHPADHDHVLGLAAVYSVEELKRARAIALTRRSVEGGVTIEGEEAVLPAPCGHYLVPAFDLQCEESSDDQPGRPGEQTRKLVLSSQLCESKPVTVAGVALVMPCGTVAKVKALAPPVCVCRSVDTFRLTWTVSFDPAEFQWATA